MTIRFGLIGCGRVAPRHAQSLMQIAETRLVAVADVKSSRADHFGAEYAVPAFYDHRALLDRADLDAVSICVPSGLHAPGGDRRACRRASTCWWKSLSP